MADSPTDSTAGDALPAKLERDCAAAAQAPQRWILGPTPEGVPPIELSEESLCAALRAAAVWAAHRPRRLLGLDEPMRVGLRLGLIGVSGPMLELIASYAGRTVLPSGEPGTEAELAAAARDAFQGLPNLSGRPQDLPLLIYYYMQRYFRGDYSAPDGQVSAVATEWLYFAAARDWTGDLGELEGAVVEACRAAVRSDGTIRVWQAQARESSVQSQTSVWPAACPFGLPVRAYYQAVWSDPQLRSPVADVAVEDLPGYDLMGLLEAVDVAAAPGQRGRWTLDYRRRHLEEACDADAAVEATAGAPLEGTRQEQAATEEHAPQYAFRRTKRGWNVTYEGESGYLRDVKGVRAIAYLLSLPDGRPKGGHAEVAEVAGIQADQVAVTESDLGKAADGDAVRAYKRDLETVENALRDDDNGALSFSDSDRSEMEKKKNCLQAEIARSTNRRGKPRRVNRLAQAVGKSIADALQQIEGAHLDLLFNHLKPAIKKPRGRDIRYEPAETRPRWEVSM